MVFVRRNRILFLFIILWPIISSIANIIHPINCFIISLYISNCFPFSKVQFFFNMLEKTSFRDNVEADNITVLINEAQSIKLASDEAQKLRNKAGFKRTKKHRKKRRKTRNNRTNKFVAQKH